MNFPNSVGREDNLEIKRPGTIVLKFLEREGISARELARRCGRSGKLVAEIISGKAPVEPETALQFERVIGESASVFLELEIFYQLHMARTNELKQHQAFANWAKSFPVKEMKARRLLSHDAELSDDVSQILKFFGVGSVKACESRIEELVESDFRASPNYRPDRYALATWLRLGERNAQILATQPYSRDRFLEALREIKKLTKQPFGKAAAKIARLLAEAGITFVEVVSFADLHVESATRWLNPKHGLIQQSTSFEGDERRWFSFFHSCAHLILHSRKSIYIDLVDGSSSSAPVDEEQARDWAADFLVPNNALRNFLQSFTGSMSEVARLASNFGVSDAIVAHRLRRLGAMS